DVTPPSATVPRLSPEIGTSLTSEPARPSPAFDVSTKIDRVEGARGPASTLREQRSWEQRWRAAGEKLRATSPPKTPNSKTRSRPVGTSPADVDRPVPHAIPQAFRIEPIPLKEATPPRIPTTSAPTAREPVDWDRTIRPEQVSAPTATSLDS